LCGRTPGALGGHLDEFGLEVFAFLLGQAFAKTTIVSQDLDRIEA